MRDINSKRTALDKDRIVKIEITPEMWRTFGIEDDERITEIVEEKARTLENSINGVVLVSEINCYGAIQVKCIVGRDASQDIVKRQLDNMQSELIREARGEDTYW